MANIRTFKNLADECLAWLDEVGETGITLTLVKQSIRAAHERRLTEERWPFNLARPKQFVTVSGQQFYTLDADFLRLMYVRNLTTNNYLVEFVDQNMYAAGYDWNLVPASPTGYALWGHGEVQNQPTGASVITVSSSNSGDNGVASVIIRGDTASGVQTETILANASGTLLFTEVLKVTKTNTWVGTMTLSAGATSLLTLAAGDYGKSYQQLYMLAPPVAGQTLEYRFYRQPSPLVNDNDRPDYPAPFEELLVWEALLDLATYNSYDQGMINYWAGKRQQLLQSMGVLTNQAQSVNQAAVYTTLVDR